MRYFLLRPHPCRKCYRRQQGFSGARRNINYQSGYLSVNNRLQVFGDSRDVPAVLPWTWIHVTPRCLQEIIQTLFGISPPDIEQLRVFVEGPIEDCGGFHATEYS